MTAVRHSLLTALATLSAVAGIAPANAESAFATPAALTPASLAKSEAILGGQPSALAAIMAAQSGRVLQRPAVPALAPASFPTALRRDIARNPVRLTNASLTSKPDVFGSVALRINRTPLDRRWHQASAGSIGGKAAATAHALRGEEAVARLEAVNRYVNANVSFVDDSKQFGKADVWLTASETLRRGRGDCEDYAIAKMQMLRAAGFSDRDLYLVVLKDLVRRADHAVLVARAGSHFYVLDNGTDALLDSDEISDYRPVMTFAASGSWIHGYRRTTAPVQMASAVIAPLTPGAAR